MILPQLHQSQEEGHCLAKRLYSNKQTILQTDKLITLSQGKLEILKNKCQFLPACGPAARNSRHHSFVKIDGRTLNSIRTITEAVNASLRETLSTRSLTQVTQPKQPQQQGQVEKDLSDHP